MNNMDDKVSMDNLVQPMSDQHLCYVRCSFCNTVLAVGIPYKRLLETVTVKCGHCSNLSFLSTRPPLQGQCLDHTTNLTLQEKHGLCGDYRKGQSSSSPSTTVSEPLSPKAPFVVKPPEKKHRLPSAYNRFMKEEIQRIKSANPEIPHREAFSAAAKNGSGLGTFQILQPQPFPGAITTREWSVGDQRDQKNFQATIDAWSLSSAAARVYLN